MRTTYTLLLLLVAAQFSFGQSKSARKADKMFAEKAFPEAIEAYEAEEELTREGLQNLADSYYYTFDSQKAVEKYQELVEQYGDLDKEYQLRYADALKVVGDYDKASEVLSAYSGEQIDIMESFENIDMDSPLFFEHQIIDANSPYNDFGPAFFDRQIVFASDRNTERPIYRRTKRPFFDLYYARVSGDALTDEGLFPGDINTDLDESNVAFSPDGQTMYFTRTSDEFERVDDARVAVVQLWKATLEGNRWVNLEPLTINEGKYSVEHPSISPDGKRLYFSSDMPGGEGSYDIYTADILDDGRLGVVKNLGPNVNSEAREQFPFVSENNNLYFASNRYTGLGGLDLYRSDNNGGIFNEAYNLGTSVNSSSDDFALIIREGRGTGFFSSNRIGLDKLFTFRAVPNLELIVNGQVRNRTTGELLPDTKVEIYTANGNVLADTIVGSDAKFEFKVRPNSVYNLKGTKELFLPIEKEVRIARQEVTTANLDMLLAAYADEDGNVNVSLRERDSITQVQLDKIYFDFDKSNIRPDATRILDNLVALLKKYPDMEMEVAAHTDRRGTEEYNLQLSQRRAASTVDYLVSQGIERDRLQSKGYGETQPVIDCSSQNCTPEQHEDNRRCEFTILK